MKRMKFVKKIVLVCLMTMLTLTMFYPPEATETVLKKKALSNVASQTSILESELDEEGIIDYVKLHIH